MNVPSTSAASPATPDAALGRLLSELRGLERARDDQVLKIVRLIDALPRRAALDALLGPLRPRLAELRPPRPLTLPRLLFRPLDPLIVNDREWREGEGTLPRGALVPLARLVEAGLDPGQLATLRAALQNHHFNETSVVEAIGRRLWPLAAPLLRELREGGGLPAAPPAGMSAAAFLECAHLAGFLLGELPAFERGVKLLWEGGGGETVHPLLRGAVYEGHATFLAALRWLRHALGDCREVYAVLGDLLPLSEGSRELRARLAAYVRDVQEGIAAFIADLAKAEAEGEGISALARRVRETAAILRGLEICRKKGGTFASLDERGIDPPTLLRRLDDACHALVETLLRRRIIERGAGEGDAAGAVRREADLLAILELQEAGRMLAASGVDYDHFLRETRTAIEQGKGTVGQLGLATRTRLLELLAGPEAAYAFFVRHGTPGREGGQPPRP